MYLDQHNMHDIDDLDVGKREAYMNAGPNNNLITIRLRSQPLPIVPIPNFRFFVC